VQKSLGGAEQISVSGEEEGGQQHPRAEYKTQQKLSWVRRVSPGVWWALSEPCETTVNSSLTSDTTKGAESTTVSPAASETSRSSSTAPLPTTASARAPESTVASSTSVSGTATSSKTTSTSPTASAPSSQKTTLPLVTKASTSTSEIARTSMELSESPLAPTTASQTTPVATKLSETPSQSESSTTSSYSTTTSETRQPSTATSETSAVPTKPSVATVTSTMASKPSTSATSAFETPKGSEPTTASSPASETLRSPNTASSPTTLPTAASETSTASTVTAVSRSDTSPTTFVSTPASTTGSRSTTLAESTKYSATTSETSMPPAATSEATEVPTKPSAATVTPTIIDTEVSFTHRLPLASPPQLRDNHPLSDSSWSSTSLYSTHYLWHHRLIDQGVTAPPGQRQWPYSVSSSLNTTSTLESVAPGTGTPGTRPTTPSSATRSPGVESVPSASSRPAPGTVPGASGLGTPTGASPATSILGTTSARTGATFNWTKASRTGSTSHTAGPASVGTDAVAASPTPTMEMKPSGRLQPWAIALISLATVGMAAGLLVGVSFCLAPTLQVLPSGLHVRPQSSIIDANGGKHFGFSFHSTQRPRDASLIYLVPQPSLGMPTQARVQNSRSPTGGHAQVGAPELGHGLEWGLNGQRHEDTRTARTDQQDRPTDRTNRMDGTDEQQQQRERRSSREGEMRWGLGDLPASRPPGTPACHVHLLTQVWPLTHAHTSSRCRHQACEYEDREEDQIPFILYSPRVETREAGEDTKPGLMGSSGLSQGSRDLLLPHGAETAAPLPGSSLPPPLRKDVTHGANGTPTPGTSATTLSGPATSSSGTSSGPSTATSSGTATMSSGPSTATSSGTATTSSGPSTATSSGTATTSSGPSTATSSGTATTSSGPSTATSSGTATMSSGPSTATSSGPATTSSGPSTATSSGPATSSGGTSTATSSGPATMSSGPSTATSSGSTTPPKGTNTTAVTSNTTSTSFVPTGNEGENSGHLTPWEVALIALASVAMAIILLAGVLFYFESAMPKKPLRHRLLPPQEPQHSCSHGADWVSCAALRGPEAEAPLSREGRRWPGGRLSSLSERKASPAAPGLHLPSWMRAPSSQGYEALSSDLPWSRIVLVNSSHVSSSALTSTFPPSQTSNKPLLHSSAVWLRSLHSPEVLASSVAKPHAPVAPPPPNHLESSLPPVCHFSPDLTQDSKSPQLHDYKRSRSQSVDRTELEANCVVHWSPHDQGVRGSRGSGHGEAVKTQSLLRTRMLVLCVALGRCEEHATRPGFRVLVGANAGYSHTDANRASSLSASVYPHTKWGCDRLLPYVTATSGNRCLSRHTVLQTVGQDGQKDKAVLVAASVPFLSLDQEKCRFSCYFSPNQGPSGFTPDQQQQQQKYLHCILIYQQQQQHHHYLVPFLEYRPLQKGVAEPETQPVQAGAADTGPAQSPRESGAPHNHTLPLTGARGAIMSIIAASRLPSRGLCSPLFNLDQRVSGAPHPHGSIQPPQMGLNPAYSSAWEGEIRPQGPRPSLIWWQLRQLLTAPCHSSGRGQRHQDSQDRGKYRALFGASLRQVVKKMEISQHAVHTCSICIFLTSLQKAGPALASDTTAVTHMRMPVHSQSPSASACVREKGSCSRFTLSSDPPSTHRLRAYSIPGASSRLCQMLACLQSQDNHDPVLIAAISRLPAAVAPLGSPGRRFSLESVPSPAQPNSEVLVPQTPAAPRRAWLSKVDRPGSFTPPCLSLPSSGRLRPFLHHHHPEPSMTLPCYSQKSSGAHPLLHKGQRSLHTWEMQTDQEHSQRSPAPHHAALHLAQRQHLPQPQAGQPFILLSNACLGSHSVTRNLVRGVPGSPRSMASQKPWTLRENGV
ncbi:hypothetical protein J0S82_004119, partial [Galemys pyrenaicus]